MIGMCIYVYYILYICIYTYILLLFCNLYLGIQGVCMYSFILFSRWVYCPSFQGKSSCLVAHTLSPSDVNGFSQRHWTPVGTEAIAPSPWKRRQCRNGQLRLGSLGFMRKKNTWKHRSCEAADNSWVFVVWLCCKIWTTKPEIKWEAIWVSIGFVEMSNELWFIRGDKTEHYMFLFPTSFFLGGRALLFIVTIVTNMYLCAALFNLKIAHGIGILFSEYNNTNMSVIFQIPGTGIGRQSLVTLFWRSQSP